MSGFEAIILGLVQGVTEFLPISSSGHLVLAHHFFGAERGALEFDVMLHLGTLLAVLFYFRRDIRQLLLAWGRIIRHRRIQGGWEKLAALLALATVPAAILGYFLEHEAETVFRSPWLVVGTLSGVGLLLLIAERVSRRDRGLDSLRTGEALGIGVAQALALVPGVSRSGVTMTAGLFLGLERAEAARFSFLLSAPIIAGAGISQLPQLSSLETGLGVLMIGFIASLVSGVVAIRWLLAYLGRHSFAIFAYYRLALAGVVALLLVMGL